MQAAVLWLLGLGILVAAGMENGQHFGARQFSRRIAGRKLSEDASEPEILSEEAFEPVNTKTLQLRPRFKKQRQISGLRRNTEREEFIRPETLNRFEPSNRRRTLHAVESVGLLTVPITDLGSESDLGSELVLDSGSESSGSANLMEEVVFSSENSANQRTFVPTRRHPILEEHNNHPAQENEKEMMDKKSEMMDKGEKIMDKEGKMMDKEGKIMDKEGEIMNQQEDMMEKEDVMEKEDGNIKDEDELRHKTRVISDPRAIGVRVNPKKFFKRIKSSSPTRGDIVEHQQAINELNKDSTGPQNTAVPQRKRQHITSRIATGPVPAAQRTREKINNRVVTSSVPTTPGSQVSAHRPREKINNRDVTVSVPSDTEPILSAPRNRENITYRVATGTVPSAPRTREITNNRVATGPVPTVSRTREQIANRVATGAVPPAPRRRMRRPASSQFKTRVDHQHNAKPTRAPINRRIKVKMVDKVRQAMPKVEETENTEHREVSTAKIETTRRIIPRRRVNVGSPRRFINTGRRTDDGSSRTNLRRKEDATSEEDEPLPTQEDEDNYTDSDSADGPPRFLTRTGPQTQLIDEDAVFLPAPLISSAGNEKIYENIEQIREEDSLEPTAEELTQNTQGRRRKGRQCGRARVNGPSGA